MPNTLTTETANGDSSNNRAETNRENAQNSTGPRTVAGKQRPSLNPLRHGLTGQTVVLPSDDLAAYERHCKGFFNQYQPKNPTEVQLTQTVADLSWRLNRATAIETNMLTLAITEKSNSVDTENDQVHTALAMAKAFREQSQPFANLTLYEHRLSVRHDNPPQHLPALHHPRLFQQL